MLKKEWMSRLSAAGFAALFVFGCSPDSTSSKLVTVQVSLARADVAPSAALAPQDVSAGSVDLSNVPSLIVKLDSVQLQTSSSEGWQTLIPPGAPLTLDLITGLGNAIDLGTTQVAIGPCEARLFVHDPTITFTNPVTVGRFTFDAGTHGVTIPSGPRTGLKADGPCEVKQGTTNVTLAFDGNATVGTIVATGNGVILLTPVIHIQQP